MPFVSTEEEVRNFFITCGEIVEIRLPKWQDSGRLRGYGHVLFSSDKCAKQALTLNGI